MRSQSVSFSSASFASITCSPLHVARFRPTPAWKRGVDLTLCLLAMPVLGLITLVMAIVMKLVSPGPVFFHQRRIGYLGRSFMILKFRTMSVGADAGPHRAFVEQLIGTNAPMIKMDAQGDARLIPGGKFIRACGLDELPQLINVLYGDMSLIGPRPCMPYEYEQYQPWQRERFGSLPGLTGLWQVSGKNRTTFDEMIRLDIEYTQRRSWWLDAKILCLTPVAIIQQLGDSRLRRKSAAGSCIAMRAS